MNKEGVQFNVPDCNRNEKLEIQLPVHSNGVVPKTHEVTFDLTYSKITHEKYTFQSCLDLFFQHPFHIEQTIIPVYETDLLGSMEQIYGENKTNRMFFHFVVTCICVGTVEILDYNLDFKDCPGSYKILNDPNQIIRNSVLSPQSRIALLFDIEMSGMNTKRISTNGSLLISYKFCASLDTSSSPDFLLKQELIYQYKLRAMKQPVDFLVECQHPAYTYKGKRSDFYWTITNIKNTENSNDYGQRYSIKVDSKHWLIAAKMNGNIDFMKEEKGLVAHVKCTLIPLICGTLPLPQFRVETTSMARIRELNSKEESIIVYPVPVINSFCERILEVPEKKKESLKKDNKEENTASLITVNRHISTRSITVGSIGDRTLVRSNTSSAPFIK